MPLTLVVNVLDCFISAFYFHFEYVGYLIDISTIYTSNQIPHEENLSCAALNCNVVAMN